MPYFDLPSSSDFSTTDFDRIAAKQLLRAIAERTLLQSRFSICKWSEEFSKLRKSVNEDEQRIQGVLDWYCKNIGKEFVPVALSAKTFRDRFVRIEMAMNRDCGPSVQITEQARRTSDRIKHLNWPKGSKEKLDVFVQLIYDFHKKLTDDLKDLRSGDHPQRLRGFAATVLNKLGSADSFATAWARTVNDRIKNWKDWSGDLVPATPKRDGKGFLAMGRQWATGYGLKSSTFDELMEALDGNSSREAGRNTRASDPDGDDC